MMNPEHTLMTRITHAKSRFRHGGAWTWIIPLGVVAAGVIALVGTGHPGEGAGAAGTAGHALPAAPTKSAGEILWEQMHEEPTTVSGSELVKQWASTAVHCPDGSTLQPEPADPLGVIPAGEYPTRETVGAELRGVTAHGTPSFDRDRLGALMSSLVTTQEFLAGYAVDTAKPFMGMAPDPNGEMVASVRAMAAEHIAAMADAVQHVKRELTAGEEKPDPAGVVGMGGCRGDE